MKKRILLLGLVILISCLDNTSSSEKVDFPKERDPWLWPFSSQSIWNTPIGDGAIYKVANFEDAENIGVDIQHLLTTSTTDPERNVLSNLNFSSGRCSGTIDLGFTLKVPDNWIVPDAGNSPYGETPNSNFAILLPNGTEIFEGSVIARCELAGPIHLPEWMKFEENRKISSLSSDGMQGGGQGASGMSALGGTIRMGELVNDEPIRHAIKINPWAEKYVHYSKEKPGWKWPAKSADNYAPEVYNREADSDILMGSLFAIPPTVQIESLNLQTIAGKKLFFALQNYGIYFTEDAAWDTWDLIVERNVELEFEEKYGFSMVGEIWKNEINTLIKSLHIVTNNTASSIGGGGKPLQPLAPDFN